MGGNALSLPSVRLTKSNYERLSADCVAKLRALYPSKRVEALGAYRAKADFGDCDVLVESGPQYDPHQAAAALGAVEVVRNGPVTSVGVLVRPDVAAREGNVFQVDLIKMEPEAFDFALSYFGHGDTGNLLGRLFHACGLALRHDGLVWYHRDGDYLFNEVVLTRDFAQALRFMGYDPQVLEAGFDTPEDIYRYVASSPFFNRDIFLLENRNAKSRVRDKKRKMYTDFLRWCEAHPDLPAFEYPAEKDRWWPRVASHFPHFQNAYYESQAALARQYRLKEKFNGAWVSEVTGMQGKELGVLMKRFRESFESPEAQAEFVLLNDREVLAARLRELQAQVAASEKTAATR